MRPNKGERTRETMEIPNEAVWKHLTKKGRLEHGLKSWMESQGAGGWVEHHVDTKGPLLGLLAMS